MHALRTPDALCFSKQSKGRRMCWLKEELKIVFLLSGRCSVAAAGAIVKIKLKEFLAINPMLNIGLL
jgi:hypothetical protein